MNGHEYRSDVEAAVHPGRREGLIGGDSMQLVTLRLFDGSCGVDAITGEPTNTPGAFTDLSPRDARALAAELLACARLAEHLRREADR
jgi:hypothetical protein